MNLKQKLGKRIQELRKSKNITQEQLTEMINMDITSLSKIETGRNYPQPDTLEKICQVLGLNIEVLFNFDEKFSNESYLDAINKNLEFLKDDNKKLKLIYKITSALL